MGTWYQTKLINGQDTQFKSKAWLLGTYQLEMFQCFHPMVLVHYFILFPPSKNFFLPASSLMQWQKQPNMVVKSEKYKLKKLHQKSCKGHQLAVAKARRGISKNFK